jgi:hypothetical protein
MVFKYEGYCALTTILEGTVRRCTELVEVGYVARASIL